ncbi:unnamed protein product, partial [Tilletia laevis]
HFITALVTVGECYHNFHHQFPMDYRNATKWYQSDPTKWSIATMSFLGLASHLHVFPDNEVRKGRLAMELQKLHEGNRDITWPTSANHLPVISWSDYQAEAKTRPLIVVSGFIHDEAFNADAALGTTEGQEQAARVPRFTTVSPEVLLAIFTETEDDPETIARNVAIEKEIDHFLGISKDAQSSSSQQAIGFTPQRREAAALSSRYAVKAEDQFDTTRRRKNASYPSGASELMALFPGPAHRQPLLSNLQRLRQLVVARQWEQSKGRESCSRSNNNSQKTSACRMPNSRR